MCVSVHSEQPAPGPAWDEVRGPGLRLGQRLDWAERLRLAGFEGRAEPRTRTSTLRGRQALLEMDCSGETLLLRRYRHGGLLRWLGGERFFDADRPFKERVVCEELRALGLGAPEVLAARARRAAPFPFLWRLELVMRRIPHATDCGAVLQSLVGEQRSSPEGRLRTRLCRAAGRFLAEVHAAGLWHADLQPKNVLVDERWLAGAGGGFHLVDLDRSVRLAGLGLDLRVSNLARLLRALEKRGQLPPRLDLAHALRDYARAAQLDWRSLWRAIGALRARQRPWHRLNWWLEGRVSG